MFLFFFVCAVDELLGKKVPIELLSEEPYRSVGLVRVTYHRIKLKSKEKNSFETVEAEHISEGTGFLIQPNVVVTAAHVVMRENFEFIVPKDDVVLEELDFIEQIEDAQTSTKKFKFKNYVQLPDKVEFFPFSQCGQYKVEFKRPTANYSPQSYNENIDVEEIDEKQRKLSAYLVVPDKWKEYLQSRGVQSEGEGQQNRLTHEQDKSDYAIIMFSPGVSDPAIVVSAPPHGSFGLQIRENYKPQKILSEKFSGFDVLSVGYPTVVCRGEYSEIIPPERPEMHAFPGKALFTDYEIMHDCRISHKCSGGPVLIQEAGKWVAIGLNIRGAPVNNDLMSRTAVLFSTEVKRFIDSSVKKAKDFVGPFAADKSKEKGCDCCAVA